MVNARPLSAGKARPRPAARPRPRSLRELQAAGAVADLLGIPLLTERERAAFREPRAKAARSGAALLRDLDELGVVLGRGRS
jgi:hypothetical protein